MRDLGSRPPPPGDPPAGRELPHDLSTRWRSWFEHREDAEPGDPGSIWSEHVHMAHVRYVFNEVAGIVQGVPDMPRSVFFDHLAYTYVHTQAVAIRRQADEGRDVTSLGRILVELVDELARDSPGWVARRSMTVEEAWHLRQQLRDAAGPLRRYVNRRIAHMTSGTVASLLTASEIHEAMDSTFDVFRKVEVFLTASQTPDLAPAIQYDWKAVFRRAWLPPIG